HLQEPGKLHERAPLDEYHMLGWHALRWLDGDRRLRWCMVAGRCGLAGGASVQLRLGQWVRALGNRGAQSMFAKTLWRLGKVRATARTVHDKVFRGPIALARDCGRAIGQQVHIAGEDNRYGFLDAAVDRLRQRRLGTLG